VIRAYWLAHGDVLLVAESGRTEQIYLGQHVDGDSLERLTVELRKSVNLLERAGERLEPPAGAT
jgi:hypothetical protein